MEGEGWYTVPPSPMLLYWVAWVSSEREPTRSRRGASYSRGSDMEDMMS